MNTLILYASKYGCAMDCGVEVKNKLSGDVVLVDIKNNNDKINLEQYDTVIIGSSIYVGAIPKELKNFCADNIDILKSKKVGIFLCCASMDEADKYFESNFPEDLLRSAKVVKAFGGEARVDKMGFMDKMIVKVATKGNPQGLKINRESLDEFARIMNS
ncbi:MAG: flavodoxin domain-containing protein [Anaerovoracaceae bacterium]